MKRTRNPAPQPDIGRTQTLSVQRGHANARAGPADDQHHWLLGTD